MRRARSPTVENIDFKRNKDGEEGFGFENDEFAREIDFEPYPDLPEADAHPGFKFLIVIHG